MCLVASPLEAPRLLIKARGPFGSCPIMASMNGLVFSPKSERTALMVVGRATSELLELGDLGEATKATLSTETETQSYA